MDVSYNGDKWNTTRDAVATLKHGDGENIFSYFKKIADNMDKAIEDIGKYDEDGVVSLSHTSQESKAEELQSKYERLHVYSGTCGDLLDEKVETPFSEEIDDYLSSLLALDIDSYSTKNIGGISSKEMQFGAGGVEYQVDRVKDKVTLSDLLNGTSPMSETLQKNYEMYKLMNPESEMSYGAYKNTFLQYGAFEYTSIRDQQLSKERWVNVGLVAGIVVASVICPVVGTALAMGVSSVELYSAISGTNVYSGRELTTGERISSGVISLAGMGLSGYQLYKLTATSKAEMEVLVDSYKNLRTNKDIPGQAHHLNQDAAFRDYITKNEGLAIKLEGNIFVDVGSPHYEAHASLEKFWDLYRKNGELANMSPMISEYNVALKESLISAGLTEKQAIDVVAKAAEQQISVGLLPDSLIPRIPGKINLPKR